LTKKIIIIAVFFTFFLGIISPSIGEENSSTDQKAAIGTNESVAATTEEKSLSMNEAINIALLNNIDYLKAGLDYDQASLNLESVQYDVRQTQKQEKDGESVVTDLQSAQFRDISPQEKELAKKAAQQAYDIAKEKVKIQVEKGYCDILKSQGMIDVKQKALKRAEEQQKIAQKKYEAGLSAKTEAQKAVIALTSAKNDLTNAKRDLINAQIAFNNILGWDFDGDLKLTSNLNYEKIAIPSLEVIKQKVLENRLEIKKAQNNAKIAELKYQLAISYQTAFTFSTKQYKIESDKANLELRQQQQNGKADAVAAVFQLQKADEATQLADESLGQAKESYDLAKRRYEIGAGTLVELLNAGIDLDNAETNTIQVIYDYNLAKYQLNTIAFEQ
jgi:hypothetical protein